jgi:competence protein ComEA
MDEQDKYSSFVKSNLLPIVLGIGGLIFFIYGMSAFSGPKQDKPDILFEAASDVNEKAVAGSSSKVKEIVVDVAGAVIKPGVYKLKADSRVQDALVAAGGMSEDADREKVEKTLNLAQKLTDGIKLYIPSVGEADQPSATSGGGEAGSGIVSINNATQGQLEDLPGIGAVTAEKIIDNRPYGSLQELVDKKAVGASVFEKIKEKISL